MNEELNYKSLAFSPFNATRILIFGFIILSVILSFLLKDYKASFILSAIIILITLSAYIITSYSEVKSIGNNIIIQGFNTTLRIENVTNIEIWWAYDFGIESIELGEGTTGKSRPTSNKINCFVKFESKNETGYIYEQIYLGTKFPSNHVYKQNEPIDKNKLVKVWDIDNCLEKLELIEWVEN